MPTVIGNMDMRACATGFVGHASDIGRVMGDGLLNQDFFESARDGLTQKIQAQRRPQADEQRVNFLAAIENILQVVSGFGGGKTLAGCVQSRLIAITHHRYFNGPPAGSQMGKGIRMGVAENKAQTGTGQSNGFFRGNAKIGGVSIH